MKSKPKGGKAPEWFEAVGQNHLEPFKWETQGKPLQFEQFKQGVDPTQYGHGSKLSHQGTAGFGPCFCLPGFHFGYLVVYPQPSYASQKSAQADHVGSPVENFTPHGRL